MKGRLTLVACHGLFCWLLTWGLGQTNRAMATRAIFAAAACVSVAPPCWTALSSSVQKRSQRPPPPNAEVSALQQTDRAVELSRTGQGR